MSLCFSCVASNMHGKSRGHIFLTGTATTAVIDSPSMGTEREKYTLSWSVNSHSSIIEYRLFYRQQPRHHQGHHHRSEESNDFRSTRVNGTRLVGMKPEWISTVRFFFSGFLHRLLHSIFFLCFRILPDPASSTQIIRDPYRLRIRE